jgi:pimeloyl-ACP methyl ester carboxylesterase
MNNKYKGGKMRPFRFMVFVFILLIGYLYSQDHKYPVEDFYNRNIAVPIDYQNPDGGTFFLYYQLSSNFSNSRPTIFFFQDSQQQYGLPGKVDELAKSYQFFNDFNVLRYQHRGREYSYIELKNADSTVNWEKAYRVLSSKQVIEDIEHIRQDLFKDSVDTKIFIFSRSGGGYLDQEYLAEYSRFVKRAFIAAAPNPVIMKQLDFIESKYLYNKLNDIDSTLHEKLKIVLERNIVPDYQLLWILKGIPYRSQNSDEELTNLINELYDGKQDLYNEYLQKKGFDFSKLLIPEKEMTGWDIGSILRPVEVAGEYMYQLKPDYVDPLYTCLRKASEPYYRLIEAQKVNPPAVQPLEKFKEVESEVFYLAGKNDHVSPYQIGIELAKYFKNYDLFIADDNHNMTIHKECYPFLRNAFFKFGIGSQKLQEARNSLECKEWKLD